MGPEPKGDNSLDVLEESNREDIHSTSQQCCRKLDRYVSKNVLVISLCFFLLFTAYNGLQVLQSSLHTDDGMGLVVLSVVYGVFAAVNLPGLAPFFVSQIGHKWTMVVAMATYLPWVLMNGHATWYTMVPSATLTGFGGGLLWVTECSYLTATATSVASQGKEHMELIIHRYFGTLNFMFSMSTSYFTEFYPWRYAIAVLIFPAKMFKTKILSS